MSDDTPVIPSIPLCLLNTVFNELKPSSSLSMIKFTTPISKSPVRVPIINPSTGVKPIEVSMDLPPSMAHMEAPFPKWQVMIFCFPIGTFNNRQASLEMYQWLVPWKPYRRMRYLLYNE